MITPLLMLALLAPRPIFDGRTLDGWRATGDAAGFQVSAGVIRSELNGGGWLNTTAEYTNFEFDCEYRLSGKGNSGVLVRGAFEVQLITPWDPPRDDLHCTGALYGHVAVSRRPDEVGGRWRHLRIRCDRDRVTVQVDGAAVCEADLSQVESLKNAARRGPLGLQDNHSDAGEWVEFRKLTIDDLDQDAGFVAAGLQHADPRWRLQAEQAAGGLGAAAVGPLFAALTEDDPVVRRSARAAIDNAAAILDPRGRRSFCQALLGPLRLPDPEARRLACRLLGELGDEAVVAPVRGLLADAETRDAALRALVRLPGDAATDALTAALKGEAELARAAAARLGERGSVRAQPALIAALNQADPELVGACARALGACGDAGAIARLKALSQDAHQAVVAAACDGLLALAGRLDPARAVHLYRFVWARGTVNQQAQALIGGVHAGDDRNLSTILAALEVAPLRPAAVAALLAKHHPAMPERLKAWAAGASPDNQALVERWLAEHAAR